MSIKRIVSYWGIASGGDDTVRYVQFLTKKTGWRGFVNHRDFQAQLDAGITRFLLWMPFGREKEMRKQTVAGHTFDTLLRFDAYQQAVAANLPWLTENFVEQFRPLTDKGIQIIAYMGSLAGSPEFEVESGIVRRQWLDASIDPFEDAQCDYAFDTAVRAPIGHYCTNIAAGLRRKGTRVYCEAMPMQAYPHWLQGDVMSSEEQYQAACVPGNRGILCDPKEIVGELVRGVWNPPPPPFKNFAEYYRAVVPEILKAGHTACIQARHYLLQGGKLEELV